MALDLYMKLWLDKGSAGDGIWPIGDNSPYLFKLHGFSHGLTSQISPGRPSQFKSGVRQSYCLHHNVTISRRMDNGSPILFEKCSKNESLYAVQIFACQLELEDGKAKPTVTLELRLSDVRIADYSYASGSDQLDESLQLHYEAIEMHYRKYDFTKDEFKNFFEPGWDRATNSNKVDKTNGATLGKPDDAFKEKSLLP